MIFVLIAGTLMGMLILGAMKPALEERWRKVPEEIDLDSVRDAVMEKHGWSRERADAARVEYLRFLTLLRMRPGFMLVPWPNPEGQDDLDQFWHQHILDTAKYAADCERLFGRMMHHSPHVVRGSEEETAAVEKTQRLYARTFGSGPYGRPVEQLFLASCGACAAVDGGNTGHGGGDHPGGHSCGSHGGGHGCGHGGGGHGCGGH